MPSGFGSGVHGAFQPKVCTPTLTITKYENLLIWLAGYVKFQVKKVTKTNERTLFKDKTTKLVPFTMQIITFM